MTEPLSQKELGAFMDGLTHYLSSTAPEPEKLDAALAIANSQLTTEPTAPAKREFTIEIITKLITPVVVWATTQEEAEHLALEQFKLAAGDGQRETSESLARLWSVIGEGGSRLTPFNKLDFIVALTNLAWKQGVAWEEELNLWSTLQRQWDIGSLALMPEATPPITPDNLEEVFSAIALSERDCWLAIAEIAASEVGR